MAVLGDENSKKRAASPVLIERTVLQGGFRAGFESKWRTVRKVDSDAPQRPARSSFEDQDSLPDEALSLSIGKLC